jgi:RHS repeat-associated protein
MITDGGTKKWEEQFLPFGKVWYHWDNQSGTSQTSYRFTGQRHETSFDLYDYGARFYDQLAGRFIQPDTIVPNPGNPQHLNRYTQI